MPRQASPPHQLTASSLQDQYGCVSWGTNPSDLSADLISPCMAERIVCTDIPLFSHGPTLVNFAQFLIKGCPHTFSPLRNVMKTNAVKTIFWCLKTAWSITVTCKVHCTSPWYLCSKSLLWASCTSKAAHGGCWWAHQGCVDPCVFEVTVQTHGLHRTTRVKSSEQWCSAAHT